MRLTALLSAPHWHAPYRMYNKLAGCRYISLIQFTMDLYFKHMDAMDVKYLNSIDDHAQYPAARCDMGENIYMCCRSASSAVEGMNAANKQLRMRTAVDLLNASLLIIKIDCE
jgi:hypothetical protein